MSVSVAILDDYQRALSIGPWGELGLAAMKPAAFLVNTSRAVLTPHLGYVSARSYEVFFRDVVECIAGFLGGQPVRVLNAA